MMNRSTYPLATAKGVSRMPSVRKALFSSSLLGQAHRDGVYALQQQLAGNKYNYYPQNMFIPPIGNCIIWALQETDTEWAMQKLKRSIRGQPERKEGEERSRRRRLRPQCGYEKNHNYKNRRALKQTFPIKCILFWEEILRPLLAIVQGLSQDCPRQFALKSWDES